MRLTVWIVTEVTADEPRASVHFVQASTVERARDLVVRRMGIPGQRLSVVPLYENPTPVPPSLRSRPGVERYLGPLEMFSPYQQASCSFCGGTGKAPGSHDPCPVCGGTGIRKTR